MLGKYDKEVYQSCKYCHQVIEIKKGFKGNAFICNICFKLLQNEDKINPQIHVIWSKNKKYRVFTNYIVLIWIEYLDLKISKINMVKFLKKQLIII